MKLLQAQNSVLLTQIKPLQEQLAQNSHNSHKPASSDQYTRPPKSGLPAPRPTSTLCAALRNTVLNLIRRTGRSKIKAILRANACDDMLEALTKEPNASPSTNFNLASTYFLISAYEQEDNL